MNSNPHSDSIDDAPKTIRKKQNTKLFSCLGVLVIFILISYVTVPILCMYFIDSFFAEHAPKQEDIDRANKTIQRINAKMDDFEESIRPIRERIETLENEAPKTEVIDHDDQSNEDDN